MARMANGITDEIGGGDGNGDAARANGNGNGRWLGGAAVERGLGRALDAAIQLPEWALIDHIERLLVRRMEKIPDGALFLGKTLRELKRRWPNLAPDVRRRFLENVFVSPLVLARPRYRRTREVLQDARPLVMVISPTMRCNLKCTGCYSANYSRKDAIDTKTFLRILGEARDMGIHFIVVSGGEPYIRTDLLDVFAAYPDLMFMTYTNGTYIADGNLAPRLAKLGNVMPCISVEGFDKETDERRGKGVFKKIIDAMGQLRSEGVLFGFSATPMRHNNELLVSDEFVRFYQNLGCFVGWYFSYMPVGRKPDLSLMPTPEQRMYRMDRIRELRKASRTVLADFWCDGPLVGGCLSGGRLYFHVNAQGGIEPCVFQQYSLHNVKDTPLIDALASDYFRDMRCKLAAIDDRTRPCPVIDHPHLLRDSVARFNPGISQAGGQATVTDLADGLDAYAKELEALSKKRRREQAGS